MGLKVTNKTRVEQMKAEILFEIEDVKKDVMKNLQEAETPEEIFKIFRRMAKTVSMAQSDLINKIVSSGQK